MNSSLRDVGISFVAGDSGFALSISHDWISYVVDPAAVVGTVSSTPASYGNV